MRNYVPYGFCIMMILAVLLVGCGGASSSVNTPTPTFISTSQTPTPIRSPTPIPTAPPIPTDIVVYPEAQLVLAQPTTLGTLYSYLSEAPLDAVTTYYMDQMPRKGWAQASAELNGDQGTYLVYTKDARSVMVNIVPDLIKPSQTDISITLTNS